MTHDLYTDPFNLSMLQAISDWQRGGDAKQNKRRGQVLKDACATISGRYRTSVGLALGRSAWRRVTCGPHSGG